MYLIHEGEILLKEIYGSTERKRLYVKPPQQNDVVIVDDARPIDWFGWLYRVFLPQGYPDSVSEDYISYQIWDTAQAFCSTITGTLATQQVLRGVGVGDSSATPLAATFTWVLKDGCGHLGKILFAYSHGSCLDAYSKKWRLYADVMNDAAMCIEIALPFFFNYTLIALCISTTMKAIVGVSGSATRVALTQHHAIRGNMGDVAAKDAAQETAVNLVASLIALTILTFIGTPVWLFLLLSVLHIAFNYLAVRSVCLKTLNEPRFLQVIESYLKHEILDSPCVVNSQEPIIFSLEGDKSSGSNLCGFQIKLGSSIMKEIKKYPSCALLRKINEAYAQNSYILYPIVPYRVTYVMFRQTATAEDMLCAYFHAVMLSTIVCALNNIDTGLYSNSQSTLRPFGQICRTLQSVDWSRDPGEDVKARIATHYEPSIELLKYLNAITCREWMRLREALLKTGWRVSKHLLVVDEWKVSAYMKKATERHLSDDFLTKSTAFSQTTFLQDSVHVLSVDEDDKEYDQTEHIFTIEPEHTELLTEDAKDQSAVISATKPSLQDLPDNVSEQSVSHRKVSARFQSQDSKLVDDTVRSIAKVKDTVTKTK